MIVTGRPSKGVNSVYALAMNIGGDGKDVHPYLNRGIDPNGSERNDNTRFDLGRLRQWGIVFDHAMKVGVHVQLVLNEAERANKLELDGAGYALERPLYYRELVARFGHLNALMELQKFTQDEYWSNQGFSPM